MLHPVDRHRGVGVGGFAAGGDAAPLVDRHIDDHRARTHLLHHRLIHQGRGSAARGQHRADHQIRRGHQALQQTTAAHHAHQPTATIRLQAAQPLG